MYYSSFHFLFDYPNITPILPQYYPYGSFHFLFHYPQPPRAPSEADVASAYMRTWMDEGLGGCIGIMENKMETTIVLEGMYWGYIGIMEKKMETAVNTYSQVDKNDIGQASILLARKPRCKCPHVHIHR